MGWGGSLASLDWSCWASWSWLCPFFWGVLNVGGWLTHCDFALDVGVDFLAVVEHRLIPARVRSEWARLRRKRLASIWALASQEASHVGHAGVGVVSLRGALFRCLLLPLLSFGVFLIVVGLFGVCFLWVVVGLCMWLFFMAIRGLIVILSGLL